MRRYRYDERLDRVEEVRDPVLFDFSPLLASVAMERLDRIMRRSMEQVFGIDLAAQPGGDRTVFVQALPPVIAGALLFASEVLPPDGILIVESPALRRDESTVEIAQPPVFHAHDRRLNQFMRTFGQFVHPYLFDSAGCVEEENPDYSPGEDAHGKELTATLLDLAKQDRKEDFAFLATSEGRVSLDKVDELWTGTRRRLHLPVDA